MPFMSPPSAKSLLLGMVMLLAVCRTHAGEHQECLPRALKIVFFLPSDLVVPQGVRHRLTQIADATDAFLLGGMKQHGYPPEVKTLFPRDAEGTVEVLEVRGENTAASGEYAQPNCIRYILNKAGAQYKVTQASHVWWVFVYLGDRPTRFEQWFGSGNPRDGGFGIVNYDTVPGDIRPDLQLTDGFNLQYKLKSTIHELCHGFGLPHMGPDPTLNLGNSLMGPNPPGYAFRMGPKSDHVYLAASEAAMLWKHPLFTGKPMPGFAPWEVKLVDYKATFDPATDSVTVTGKVITQQPAHSVVLIDDRGDKKGDAEYWSRSYAARLAADGSFQLNVNNPARTDGQYRILFCFENGIVSGNGKDIDFKDSGDIRRTYRFIDERFQFKK